ncbi:hypothetical protein M33023_01400 [Candidatus Phytoplasma asteris]|uniref:Uncharacterized protein n=1 Tax=Candidatus Phytoplasma asteris TaxID=85620 RepID=A0ABZ2YEI7_9MOLU
MQIKIFLKTRKAQVVKEFKVDKNNKLLDKHTNKQVLESLRYKFKLFNLLYKKVTQSLNLYLLVLSADKKTSYFSFFGLLKL